MSTYVSILHQFTLAYTFSVLPQCTSVYISMYADTFSVHQHMSVYTFGIHQCTLAYYFNIQCHVVARRSCI